MTQTIDASPLLSITLDSSIDEDGFDVFSNFDHGDDAPQFDPYPEYIRLRKEQPIRQLSAGEQHVYMPADRPAFEVFCHADVSRVARESDIFTSDHHSELIGQVFGRSILEMNGAEHSAHRKLIQHAFKSQELARWRSGLIPSAINSTIESFKHRGHADLAKEFTLLYPVKVIEGMMGLPEEHCEWFHRRAIEEIMFTTNPTRAFQAAEVLKRYFEEVIEIRREHPGQGDIITLLIEAEVDGQKLGNEEIIPFLMLLAPAGAETTYRGTGTLIYALLSNPEYLEAVSRDAELLQKSVDEAMRWEAPLATLTRRVSQDVTLSGVTVPAGANISAHIASANHDPDYWEPADTVGQFDLYRPRKPSLTFAGGAHVCLGLQLARAEMADAMQALINQLPGLRLDPEQRASTYITGETWRSPNKLPVLWDV